MNHKKNLFAIFLFAAFFAVPVFALAAKTVPGEMPVLTPLQPAPVGISPDFQNSISRKDDTLEASSGLENVGAGERQAGEQNNQTRAGEAKQLSYTISSKWAVWVIIVLGIVLAYAYFRIRYINPK